MDDTAMKGPVIVVGAGQAGLQAAESLRTEGYAGALTLIGDEDELPYHRPPLSKQWLLGEGDEAQLPMRSQQALERKSIEVMRAARVVSIERDARTVTLADGRRLPWQGLVLATGAAPRALPVPGAGLEGVLALRSIADARALSGALAACARSGREVVVVGGGFIGLEVAAAARKLGAGVLVLESADRLMARAVTPIVSQAFARLHAAHGVRIATGAQVLALTGADGRVSGVRTADDALHAAGCVVVGVGAVPNDRLASAAGVDCRGGVVIDACSRTSAAGIVAAGDCTVRRLDDGSLLRLESVQAAVEQAKSAAAALMGRERAFHAAPWFWSDQFDVKLQIAGSARGADRFATRGDPDGWAFSVFSFRDGALAGVESLNRSQDHMLARRLLDKGVSPTPDQAADESFDLKALLA